MKKALPYLLALVLGAAVMTLFFSAKKKSRKVLDERFTLRKTDMIPYGSWMAYNSLPYVFPLASISVNRYEPGYWDSLSNYEEKQVLFILTSRFDADKEELIRMTKFAENGNDVFICAQYISSAADKFFKCSSSSYNMSLQTIQELDQGMKIILDSPPFDKKEIFGYPGRSFETYFTEIDTLTTDILGYDRDGRTNFIRLQAGKGFVYVHLEPFAFTNYFILHKSNINYYEKLMSLLPKDAKTVVWDEYYLTKRAERHPKERKSWFSVLMGMKNEEGRNSFRAAFLILAGLLLLYVFMEMRRKQRYIPVIRSPRNDSLDFVKTVGRLYYDKGDHKNLARKMSSYFLEHVRHKYKLPKGSQEDEFTRNLSYKTNISESELRPLVTFIRYAEDAPVITAKQLMEFHRQLESFYQKA